MRRGVLAVAVALSIVLAGVAPAAATPAASEEPTRVSSGVQAATDDTTRNVTILSYNDVQTAAAQDGNFPRLVTAIQQRRAAHDGATVVVGAGDQVSPHALSPVSQWRAPVSVLNEVDPAADVVGNHELDFGYDAVSNVTDDSEFPWLATNVVNDSTGESFEGTREYEIVERNGVRVGVIGLIDRGAAEGKTNIDFSEEGARIENYTVDGPRTAERLKAEENVDVVVAVAHTGIGDAKTLARADESDAIDVIAVGDDEQRYPPQETAGSIVTEAEARATYLGELNLTVDTAANDVVAYDGRLVTVNESTYEKNETASGIIEDYRAEVSLDSTVVRTTEPLDSRFASNYHRETGYGNLITDSMRAETGATVAITNAGGIRSNTVYAPNATAEDPGNVTGGDVFNTLPFPNTLVTYEMTGSQLRETLRSQVVTLDSDTGQQYGQEVSQQVSGVRFEWVAHEGAGRQIRDLYVNTAGPTAEPDWVRVEDDETYTVTVNSYMASGGSGYPLPEDKEVVSRTDQLLAVTLIDYLEQRDTVGPTVEGRMERVDRDLEDVRVRLDGDGAVVLVLDRPRDLASVDADSVVIEPDAPGAERVPATRVVATPKRLVVAFDDQRLAAIATPENGTADLELYADYGSTEYGPDRVYFESSRLNAEVNATVATDRGNASSVAAPGVEAADAG